MSRQNDQLQPFVKWLGGKRSMLPHIRPLLPQDIGERVYYEPFVGAGALLFDLQPRRAIIGDINANLMYVYETIRDDIKCFIECMKHHEMHNSVEHFYTIRSLDRRPDVLDSMTATDRAARTLYLCRTSYSGLYRENIKGKFNAAYGYQTNRTICDEARLLAVHKYLNESDIEILNCDYADAIKTAGSDAFIFLDPPYHRPNNVCFNGYTRDRFNEREQDRLRDTMKALHDRGVKAMLCNADTEFIRELYSKPPFKIHEVPVKRKVFVRKGGKQKHMTDLIITTYEA